MGVSEICDLLDKIEGFNINQAPQYKNVIRDNNINGKVLLHCDMQELKKVSITSTNFIIYFRLSSRNNKISYF